MSTFHTDHFWEILKDYKPDVSASHEAFRNTTKENDTIGKKERELIRFAIACAAGYKPSIHSHAKMCYEAGATKEEIFSVIVNIMSMLGVCVAREITNDLEEFFLEK